MILVSSCLLGVYAKYDGTPKNKNDLLLKYCRQGKYLPVCPEQLGGLGTPRSPVEIIGGSGGDVLAGLTAAKNSRQEDVTQEFIRGAEETLRLARIFQVKAAILKERSPSCGVNRIYNGDFNGIIREGSGVTADLLRQNGIQIYSEEDLTEDLLKELLE